MFRDYREILDYLYTSLPMYQRTGPAAYKADLGNILSLDNYFDNPHRNYPSIHIAGTNGKGSVAHMLASVCQVSGMKTGLYTSPHLKDFTERIRVDGNPIPQQKVLQFFRNHIDIFDKLKPSFFEMTVALAFWWFREMWISLSWKLVWVGDSTLQISLILLYRSLPTSGWIICIYWEIVWPKLPGKKPVL